MASLQPIVCNFLKLPPQEILFSRLRELYIISVNRINQLAMGVAASHPVNNSSATVQAVQDLRKNAAKHCPEFAEAIHNACKVAAVYLNFVQNLLPPLFTEQIMTDIRTVYVKASLELKSVEAAYEAMTEFERDIADCRVDIEEAWKKDNETEEGFTSTENGQAVDELGKAVDECTLLLRQVSDYHMDLMAQTRHPKEQDIRSNMPSDGEITTLREQWTNYLTTMREVKGVFDDSSSKLLPGEENLLDGQNPNLGTEATRPSSPMPKTTPCKGDSVPPSSQPVATPQVITCDLFKLPPQEHIFCRIRELSEIFMNKIDHLSMVVGASDSASTSLVAVQAMCGLREDAINHFWELDSAVLDAFMFAIQYLTFVGNLSSLEVSHQTFVDIRRAYLTASLEVETVEETRQFMAHFKQDITDAVARIRVALKDESGYQEVFTAENGQVATELLQAIDECNDLLRQVGDFHVEMRALLAIEKEKRLRFCIPSKGEVVMMQERWTNYIRTVGGVVTSLHSTIIKLDSAEGIERDDCSSEAGTSASGPSSRVRKPKVSLWRSFVRHTYSCLTSKYFV